MSHNNAYDEGYDAYWDGVDCIDNPFGEEELDNREQWESGWRVARKHDYDESEGVS